MHAFRFTVPALVAAVALNGCGGGGSSNGTSAPVTLPTSAAIPAQKNTSVTFTITIPKQSESPTERRREYVSVNTQSVTIQQLSASPPYKPVGAPEIVNVTPTSPGCSSNNIQTKCVLNFLAVPGTFNVAIQSFGGVNGSGSLLAENTLATTTVVAGVANTLSVTLNGVIASLALPNSVSGTLNAPQTVAFAVEDPTGATIVGAGTYDNGPLTVADNSGLVTLSPASFAAPSAGSTFSLQCNSSGSGTLLFSDSGGGIATLPYVCGSASISLSPGSLDFDALASSPSDPTYDQNVTVTDSNQNVLGQTPFLSCTPGSGNQSGSVALASSPQSDIWTLRPIDVGTCTFFVQDQLPGGETATSQTIVLEVHTATYTVQAHVRAKISR